jgi:two-component system, cell cycle response regulator DivK
VAVRILIAEDHPDSLELMRYLLQSHDYQTLVATDGASALALARALLPDLILCDLQMPVMDGYQVAAALKGDPRLCAIPLLAVTAFSMLGDRERILAAGFDGYFSKPIDVEHFVGQIQRYLAGSAAGEG